MNEEKDVILITGCSGRIGTRIINRFKNSTYHLVGLDLVPPPEETPDNFSYFKMDISSPSDIQQVLGDIQQRFGNRLASVIHLAAYYNFNGGEWSKYETITVKGTQHLLEAAQQFKTEQFIFSSTMLVHAAQNPPTKINENSPLSPSWEYPHSKIETEKVIHEKHGKIPYVILEIAGCYDDECHSIPLSNQIQRIYENQFVAHVFPGDLSHGTSFLHLDDLAEVIWLTVNKRGQLPSASTLLVGEEETLSYDQLQRRISKLIHGKEWATYRVPKWFAKTGAYILDHCPGTGESFIKPWMIDFADENYSLDLTRIKKTLGWQSHYQLSEKLPIMIELLKKDPLKWYQTNHLTPPHWLTSLTHLT